MDTYHRETNSQEVTTNQNKIENNNNNSPGWGGGIIIQNCINILPIIPNFIKRTLQVVKEKNLETCNPYSGRKVINRNFLVSESR